MIRHQVYSDYDFSFVRGLTSFREWSKKTCLGNPIANACIFLAKEYLFPVEYITATRYTYYLKVPEGTPEVMIGWVGECIKWVCYLGVELIIIESDEDASVLKDIVVIQDTLEKDLKVVLKEQGKVAYTDNGYKLVKDQLVKTLDSLREKELTDYHFTRPLTVEITLPSKIHSVEIMGVFAEEESLVIPEEISDTPKPPPTTQYLKEGKGDD